MGVGALRQDWLPAVARGAGRRCLRRDGARAAEARAPAKAGRAPLEGTRPCLGVAVPPHAPTTPRRWPRPPPPQPQPQPPQSRPLQAGLEVAMAALVARKKKRKHEMDRIEQRNATCRRWRLSSSDLSPPLPLSPSSTPLISHVPATSTSCAAPPLLPPRPPAPTTPRGSPNEEDHAARPPDPGPLHPNPAQNAAGRSGGTGPRHIPSVLATAVSARDGGVHMANRMRPPSRDIPCSVALAAGRGSFGILQLWARLSLARS